MSTDAHKVTLEETVAVDLDGHPSEEYADISRNLHGGYPAVHNYTVRSAADVDRKAPLQEAEQTEAEGIRAQAWIDLNGDHARVLLNPNLYADTPADELLDEAQRILLEWAFQTRQELDIEPPPATAM